MSNEHDTDRDLHYVVTPSRDHVVRVNDLQENRPLTLTSAISRYNALFKNEPYNEERNSRFDDARSYEIRGCKSEIQMSPPKVNFNWRVVC